MKKRLLDEFIENPKILMKKDLKIKELTKLHNNSFEMTNSLIEELNIPKLNQNIIKFLAYELTGNIYDHSEFDKAYILGKVNNNTFDLIVMDDGISIIDSFKNANYSFKNDCDALIKAANGLSTKNELGYIERGTGLNNTINIVANGFNGEILLISGNALLYITKTKIIAQKIPKDTQNGTIIYLRMNLKSKIDIYNYLSHIEYKL